MISKTERHNRIAESINTSGLTKTRIAREIGVSRGAISNWVSGRDTPTDNNLLKLAVLLSKPPEHFGDVAGDNAPMFETSLISMEFVGLDGAPDEAKEFPAALLLQHELQFSEVVLTRIPDARMAPVLPPGTVCVFKKGQRQTGVVSLIRQRGWYRVCRVFPHMSDSEGVRLSFDGEQWPDEYHPVEDIVVVGTLAMWVGMAT